jgi:hypothetical protein
MSLRHLVLAALAALAFQVAPAAAQTAPAVRPLADIIASGPTFTDITSDSVTVLLDTSIPVVCAAVYGLTTDYGGIATDSDMAGGAHSNHHPTLRGLKPDTTYQLRMQGVAADGTLYVSRNYVFHTLAASPAALAPAKPAGRNVALAAAGAKVVAVSSNFGGGNNDSAYGAAKAIDGSPITEWSSNGDGDKAWIEIDLGKPTALAAVGFFTRTMGTSAQITSFQVKTEAGKVLGPFTIPDARTTYYFPVSGTARTLRFEVLKSSGGNTGAAEIEVYAQP